MDQQTDQRLAEILAVAGDTEGPRVFLTGAGISADSGIPTFRGPEGYWRVGSRNYQPEELATYAAFARMPREIWAWYLYRWSICHAAEPNAAHRALAAAEHALGDQFQLITQNVDGLHLRAGNSAGRTFQIHGNLHFTRCAADCHRDLHAMPEELLAWPKDQAVDATTAARLHCPGCDAWLRPNVLWFDECYDEERYRFESSMAIARRCGVLVIIGTSGATNLPMQVAQTVAAREVPLIVIDPEPSPFTEMAAASRHGCFVRGTAGGHMAAICRALTS